ncbi:MAG: hypothetical protein RSC31_01265 [Anaerovoracaceae bacterium]
MMLEKSISMNIVIGSKNFFAAIGTFVGCLCLGVYFAGVGSVFGIALLYMAFIGEGVFTIIGLNKICNKSLFGEEAYLYMTLPISNINIILGKIFAGVFWLGIQMIIIAVVVLFIITDEKTSIWDLLINNLILQGMTPIEIGISIGITPILLILYCALLVGILLTLQLVLNILNPRKFKPIINIIVTVLTVAAVLGAMWGEGKIVENLLEDGNLILVLTSLQGVLRLGIITILVMICNKILDKKYCLE